MTETPSTPHDSASEDPASRLPASTLLLGAGGLLLILGAFLPWVTIGAIGSISGVNSRYGLGTLLIGVMVLVATFGVGRIFSRDEAKAVMIIAAAFGAASLVLALYVGFATRDSVAEGEVDDAGASEGADSSSDDLDAAFEDFGKEFEESLAEFVKVGTGVGVYATALGGALVAGGGYLASRRRA